MAACQLSRAMGLRVLGTAGTPEGMKLVLSSGAHLAFNHREDGYTDKILVFRQKEKEKRNVPAFAVRGTWIMFILQEATGGQGVDVIVEMLSNVNLSKDLQMLAYGGRVMVSVTSASGSFEEEDHFKTQHLQNLPFSAGRWLQRLHRDQSQRHHGQREQHHRSGRFLRHTGTKQRHHRISAHVHANL